MAYGDLVLGEIRPAGDVDVYTFEGKIGDMALIVVTDTINSSPNDLTLEVEVFDSNGKSVVKGRDDSKVTLTISLTAIGRYSIVVKGTRYSSTNSGTGTYTLSLNNVASGPGTAVGYGGEVIGGIRPAGDVDIYTFEAKAGDVALIVVTDTINSSPNDLTLQVEVFNPQGTTMAKGVNDDAVTLTLNLTATGRYSIVVKGEPYSSSNSGTGTYTLVLEKIGG